MKKKKEIEISQIFKAGSSESTEIPVYKVEISAGFPSPASDYIESTLDINKLLIKNPSATFFLRVEGNSMVNAGIHSGDLLVVDRSKQVDSGDVIIAAINEELTVKRIHIRKNRYFLAPENEDYEELEVTADMEFYIWGVVTYVIHKV
ncbi:MAG: translesion error-prone DNA polymerase V autoproteolytic subunit [Candidatus Cloacimonetes bacterium]|nr:translesion error-prone DNA polymerase V autoproteolytic subunit [Candidatus Cloacimonadota bacterium]MBS3767962.1 translesion error-prone DNA polymerase V autoproteolytic subunit [Candidatus Cloacimonadota bacterium]